MHRVFIATPARPGARTGNLHTATRWAAMLRSAGWRCRVGLAWQGERCEVLLALHARRSHDSVARFAGPRVVALTGTDLYHDLPRSPEARRSLALADRLIVLQEHALRALTPAARRKARVVYQSSATTLRHAPPRGRFRVCVVGHLRAVKDPFRAFHALSRLARRDLELVQVGGALDAAMGPEAKRLMARDRRYRWVGSVPHARALRWIARSHVLVVSSQMEGGANVIAEAARIGTPVLASRVSGNVGMLGASYPGYFRLGDAAGLARLIERCAAEPAFHAALKARLRSRRARFAPAAERRALLGAVREALRRG